MLIYFMIILRLILTTQRKNITIFQFMNCVLSIKLTNNSMQLFSFIQYIFTKFMEKIKLLSGKTFESSQSKNVFFNSWSVQQLLNTTYQRLHCFHKFIFNLNFFQLSRSVFSPFFGMRAWSTSSILTSTTEPQSSWPTKVSTTSITGNLHTCTFVKIVPVFVPNVKNVSSHKQTARN